jgi:phage tail sheath gpL-like
MNAINFRNIPQNVRVPLFYAELNNSQANTGGTAQNTLIIGQITAEGTAAPNMPVQSQGAADAIVQGGLGSQLAVMTAAYLANDPAGSVWYLPLADAGGATAASGTITFTGPTTANGTLALYVAGELVSVALTSGETATQVATAVAAAINGLSGLPVTATAAAGVVTVTAINKGLAGNDIDIRINYEGAAAGEVLPAGLTVAIVAMSAGATNPPLAAALANLGDQNFDFVVCPFTDTVSLNALQAFFSDTAGRWSWQSQEYGGFFSAIRGTLSNCTTFGTGRNDQHGSVMGFYDSPTPGCVWAAAYAGAVAASIKADPALPLTTLPIYGVLAPPLASRFTLTERNTLLYDGVSTFTVDASGVVQIEKAITTYQLNGQGQPDDSYLEVEELYTLMYCLRSLANVVTSKYSRVKLGADGNTFAPGSGVVTPSTIKSDIIANYQELVYGGYAQNAQAFAQSLIVQQNANNPNRVDVLWPGATIDRLGVLALLAMFRLQ